MPVSLASWRSEILCLSAMDVPPLTSPPSIRVYDQHSGYEPRFSTCTSPSICSRGAMPIPNARSEPAPPPLPPPRFIEEFEYGYDPGWRFANRDLKAGFPKSTLAPIKQGSSLYGGYKPPRPKTETKHQQQPEEWEVIESDRRSSIVSTLCPHSQPDIKMGSLVAIEEDGQKPSSPSTTANQRLQGENPLAQQSFQNSSEAYDKHLLSKIGKTNSPPRQSSKVLAHAPALGPSCPPQAEDRRHLQRLSVSDVPAASLDPVSRWVTSPASAGVSPGSRSGWRDVADYRSPSVDSSAPSSAVDSDYYSRHREVGRGSLSGLRLGNDDTSSLPSRSNRGSYDQQAFLTEPETDSPMEETGGFRKLTLGEQTPPYNGSRQPFSKQQGLKRRALSPPAEAARDEKSPTSSTNHVSELHQRSGTSYSYSRSSNPRIYSNYGSVSSTSSAGPKSGSYASSVGFSGADSSMTSISSIDRPSPGGRSPSSDLDPSQDSPHVHKFSVNPPSLNTHALPPRSHHSQNPPASRSATVARAMSSQSTVNDVTGRGGASRIEGAYMCDCCPKKPRKFTSVEELQNHMTEKQYKCSFCQNRFKNKNEAERHQNSLHLRRHSWSCAAIPGYEAAFHPSTSPMAQTPNGPSVDVCGYCGEEFSNFSRDWEARIEHLTNIHKFGECNQTKKFFRADHFRQHLKHSHAGNSGKWTNMLETACIKDEPSSDAAAETVVESTIQKPTAPMSSPSLNGGSQ